MNEATFLTVEETAQLLRRSRRAVAELTGRRAIPHRKMSGTRRVLYPRAELLAWLDGAALEVVEERGSRIVRVTSAAKAAA